MQKLWATRCDWDAILPDNMYNEWSTFYTQLSNLTKISILRWTGQGSDTVSAEILGFADASTVGYGAVVYLKLIKLDGSVQINLLTAKSKVAPLKPLTIPRLELCAAVLLARLIVSVRSQLNDPAMRCHCWTNSTVTLAWLKQPPSRWKIFVAYRVHEVQTRVPDAIWHHIASQQNPADLVSRGVNPIVIKTHNLWWQGPEWLKLPSTQWPEEIHDQSVDSFSEARVNVSVHVAQTPIEWNLSTRFSSWTKLQRVIAYVIRFTNRLRCRQSPRLTRNEDRTGINTITLALQPEEIALATKFWFKYIQQQLFWSEYLLLKDGKSVSKTSKLSALTPFIDQDDLIKVRGHLNHSNLADKTKHPIVLASHPLVSTIIRYIHLQALHAGPQLTLSIFREEFWLLRARQTVRSILYRCVACMREKALVSHEQMGQLPDYRPAARAFSHCGLDYAGPIQIRSTPGRGYRSRKAVVAKVYRSVHLYDYQGSSS